VLLLCAARHGELRNQERSGARVVRAEDMGKGPAVTGRKRSPYTEHRRDGWPLCPSCGEDELYSLAEEPSVESIRGCYRCAWFPEAK
jgi:hypothetical protein